MRCHLVPPAREALLQDQVFRLQPCHHQCISCLQEGRCQGQPEVHPEGKFRNEIFNCFHTETYFRVYVQATTLDLNIALDNYSSTLMKVRTQQAELTSIKPYLEHFSSLTLKAYFTNNNTVTPILPMYINRNIITLGDMLKGITVGTK